MYTLTVSHPAPCNRAERCQKLIYEEGAESPPGIASFDLWPLQGVKGRVYSREITPPPHAINPCQEENHPG